MKNFLLWIGLCLAPCLMASVDVHDVRLTGAIAAKTLELELSLTARATRDGETVPILVGDVTMAAVPEGAGWHLVPMPGRSGYLLVVEKAGTTVQVTINAIGRFTEEAGGGLKMALMLPEARTRFVQIQAAEAGIQLDLADVLGLKRDTVEGKSVISGYLKPGAVLQLHAIPKLQREVEAELLAASEVNAIASVSPGMLRVDTLFRYTVNQGALRELTIAVPTGITVTQVNGQHIRDWRLAAAENGQHLIVQLNQDQKAGYVLQVLAERALETLPTTAEFPVLTPLGVTRVDGAAAIGTSSAVQIQVEGTTGLSQIDASAFPRLPMSDDQPRTLPTGNLFCYTFAAAPFQLSAAFSDIVPAVDAETWLMIGVEDDDLTLKARVQLDVRDAPIRRLVLRVPPGFIVSNVSGQQVVDYALGRAAGDRLRELTIELGEPMQGQVMLEVQLEMGRTPLDTAVPLGFAVDGARSERGFVSVSTAQGVQVDAPVTEGMRTVHTRSLPMRVANAQFAWRFREAGWKLTLPVKARPAAIRAEAFHLLSLGDGVAYGTVAVSYFISGAPVDQLLFRLDERLENVEFVGLDVTRWEKIDGVQHVFLRRKVIGDYNLGVTYTQRYGGGETVEAGGVQMEGVETQNGFVVAASHLNMQLDEGEMAEALIPIGTDELPDHYRLLVSAPILRTWKYVRVPHTVVLTPQPYARGETPPVLAEFVSATSALSMTPDHEAESVTKVRYIIKNSSAQFLDLKVPKAVNIWATRLITKDGTGKEKEQRLTAAREGDLLKIPLPRQRNPNEPFTVEVEFGQLHGGLGWTGHLELSLPPSPVHTTFADWQVTAPDGWALLPAGEASAMGLTTEQLPSLSLADLGGRVALAWFRSIQMLWMIAFGIPLLFFAALVVRKKAFSRVAIGLSVVALLVLGGVAWFTVRSQVNTVVPQTLAYSQVLNLSPDLPMTVVLKAVPAWRWQLSLTAFLGMLVVAGGGFFWWRSGKLCPRLGAGVVFSAIFVVLLQLPAGRSILVSAATWGIPVALLVWMQFCQRRRKRVPTTVILLACLMLGSFSHELRAAEQLPSIDSVSAEVVIQDDSADVTMQMKNHGGSAFLLPLSGKAPIILEAPAGLTVQGDIATLLIPAGEYASTLHLLLPLASPKSVEIGVPSALSRRIRLVVPGVNLTVQAAGAIRLDVTEVNGQTIAEALFPPHLPVRFEWQPKIRNVAEEQTVFYADTTTLARADNGLIESFSLVQLRIAQGRLRELNVVLPADQSVTRVKAEALASWRFDPDTHTLNIQLAEPVIGEWSLFLSAQIPAGAMPYDASLQRLSVPAAQRQRGSIGLANSSSVFSTILEHPRVVNLGDFTRDAQPLLDQLSTLTATDVTQAWRQVEADDVLKLRVEAVLPEIRVAEGASFSIGDDMIVYSSDLQISIAKAGVFSIDLLVPDAYDVESLAGPAVSHWDERADEGRRRLRVHFKQKFQGETRLTLGLSMTADRLEARFEVPRVSVEQAMKHSGQLVVSTARGIRLAVRDREGVSELDVARLGLEEKPALAFKLLRPDWHLTLERELVEPRINLEFLHVGTVSDGLIRHLHALRFMPLTAGLREFTVVVPDAALGLQITGPEIARKEEISGQPGHWQIELSGKWFDRPYPLQLTYETRYKPDEDALHFQPVVALGSDLQQGYLVIKSSNRVEVSVGELSESLQPAEARTIPAVFGVGDLADAAFCYSTNTGTYDASFKATRHTAADLLAAEVQSTDLTTVVSRHGDTITQVKLQLLAGGMRHLQATLPPDARVWCMLVDRQPRTPSKGEGGRLLIPLPQTTGTDLTVEVELIYVQPGNEVAHRYEGPRFDLPLREITWNFYLPEDWIYHDFQGTLTPDEQMVEAAPVQDYSIDSYRDLMSQINQQDIRKAVELQSKGQELAQQGQQKAARQAYEQAYNYSLNDRDLNEDARVNLRRLVEQQAVVGLVSRRSGVRKGETAPSQQDEAQFTANDAERIQSALSKPDSENLERIVNRMTDMQEAAADLAVQLMVNLPERGRHLVFERPLQVEPNAEMVVTFDAWRKPASRQAGNWLGALVLAIVLGGIFAIWPWLRRGYEAYHEPLPEPEPEDDEEVEL